MLIFKILSNSSIASSLAVKILAPRFGRLCHYYSKAKHADWFDGMLEKDSDTFVEKPFQKPFLKMYNFSIQIGG